MEFVLNTSSFQYPEEEDRLLLQDLGFTFIWDEELECYCKVPRSYRIEINSLEELLALVKKYRVILLMEGYLEIYD